MDHQLHISNISNNTTVASWWQNILEKLYNGPENVTVIFCTVYLKSYTRNYIIFHYMLWCDLYQSEIDVLLKICHYKLVWFPATAHKCLNKTRYWDRCNPKHGHCIHAVSFYWPMMLKCNQNKYIFSSSIPAQTRFQGLVIFQIYSLR